MDLGELDRFKELVDDEALVFMTKHQQNITAIERACQRPNSKKFIKILLEKYPTAFNKVQNFIFGL